MSSAATPIAPAKSQLSPGDSDLLLGECPRYLIRQRLHQIREGGALGRFDVHLGRHAGDKLEGAQALQFLWRESDARRKVRLIELRFFD